MTWPATMDECAANGYFYAGPAKTCDCGTQLMWFITPNKKWMPVSALKDSKLVPHHSVCERVKQFRKAAQPAKPEAPKQGGLF